MGLLLQYLNHIYHLGITFAALIHFYKIKEYPNYQSSEALGFVNYSVSEALPIVLYSGITYELLLFTRSDGSGANSVGFASQLSLLVDALNMSFEAQFMEDFVSGSSVNAHLVVKSTLFVLLELYY